MEIGKISYSKKLKSLSFPNFKKFWESGEEKRTGLTAKEAAKIFEIKVPVKKKTDKGD